MTRIEGAEFSMGSAAFYADEGPVHLARINSFELDEHPVTNTQFAAFIDATGYRTVAETPLDPTEFPRLSGDELQPGGLVFTRTAGPVDLGDWRAWWSWTPGASWRHPLGPSSTIAGRDDHPVVQVSHADADAYATWAGKRLPTEAEWEYASRGGNSSSFVYAWGNEVRVGDALMANTWQGAFPYLNTGANGWEGTSPVGSFAANGYGLVDMIGNVWEWTSTYYSDRHSPTANVAAVGVQQATGCACSPADTARAASSEPGSVIPRRALKGGSHLCAPEYCLRYRPAARSPQADDTATSHIGFRCARSL